MVVTINDNINVLGDKTAKNLYIVTTVDSEDTEDTASELFLAEDDDQLEEIVRKEFVGETEEDEEEDEDNGMTAKFNEDWGCSILYTLIGTVN